MSIIPTQFDWIYQLYIEEQVKKQQKVKAEETHDVELFCCGSGCEHCENKNIKSYESRS